MSVLSASGYSDAGHSSEVIQHVQGQKKLVLHQRIFFVIILRYSTCYLQLFNGSFANITKQFGVDGLRKRLDKFFSRVSETLITIT